MEEYSLETQLIFKLHQRKLAKMKTIADHVVSQLVPDWRENKQKKEEDADALKRELGQFFKLSRECRLLEDTTLFRISAEKKLSIRVHGLKNIPAKGTKHIVI